MPPVSQAQRRWAYWTLKHGSKKAKKVARDFVGHGVTELPERVEKSGSFTDLINRVASIDTPETLVGAAMRHRTTGRVFSIEGFDGGHGSVWDHVKQVENLNGALGEQHVRNTHYEDGFMTSGGRFVGRSEALEIAKRRHQWNGRNRHVTEPDGKPGLMSEAVQKALNIEERYHDPESHIVLHVRRQDKPHIGVEMGLFHLDHHPEGTWWVDNIVPLKGHQDGPSPEYRTQQNQFGTAHMRQLFRHLHDVYGVKKLTGTRVTGSREKFDKFDKDTTFNLGKTMTHSPFSVLLDRLQKAEYFKRLVQFIGGTNPKPKHMVEDTNLNSTLRRDGRLARIKVGAVKMGAVPEQKKGKLRREVTNFMPKPGVKYRDSDTEKYTPNSDGSVSKIQFFAKSAAFRELFTRLSGLN